MSTPPEAPPIPSIPDVAILIKLTPQQKAIVFEETGRNLDEFYLDDENGLLTSAMDRKKPEDFTLHAIKEAKRLNEYDEDYHEYLIALAAWQEAQGKPDPEDERARVAEIEAMQEAERQRIFYEKEAMARAEAREMAKELWKKKDKSES